MPVSSVAFQQQGWDLKVSTYILGETHTTVYYVGLTAGGSTGGEGALLAGHRHRSRMSDIMPSKARSESLHPVAVRRYPAKTG